MCRNAAGQTGNAIMKKKLKIDFTDFWSGFNKEENIFINMLRDFYDVEISSHPDLLFYSCYSFNYIKYNCLKIFYTAENVRPDFKECDFALSFDYDEYGGKNLRLPLYRWRGDLETFTRPKDIDKILEEKKKFCCMLVSNPNGKERNFFFEKLSKYKKVDSGGSYCNNIGGQKVADKMAFIKDYRFTLSFENASYPGYTTEKLVEPMVVNSIPIYWGNSLAGNDFNTKSFVNVHDYAGFDEAIEAIITIDKNELLYRQYLQQPYFKNNIFPSNLSFPYLSAQLQQAVEKIMLQPAVANTFTSRCYSLAKKTRAQMRSALPALKSILKNKK